MLKTNMPSFNDAEGAELPIGLPPVIDAHVHVFPGNISAAIRKWFDENAWHIRYEMRAVETFEFLLSRGVSHIIALQYAHKPGISRELNQYLSEKCKGFEKRVTGMATVFPEERGAEEILTEAFELGLGGLKLHAHVQCFDMNGEAMNRLYECCRLHQKPIVMHVGREPKSTAYRCDPYEICSAEKLEQVLKDFPDLKICVPHLGFDEFSDYRKLVETYDNLWLDTTMVLVDYFDIREEIDLGAYRLDRIMYGTDFPNIPYAWDREIKALKAMNLEHRTLEKILGGNAENFFGLEVEEG